MTILLYLVYIMLCVLLNEGEAEGEAEENYNYISLIMKISTNDPKCLGALINCCVVITSCSCLGEFKFKNGAFRAYPQSDLYVIVEKLQYGKKYSVRTLYANPTCHTTQFDVYGHDIAAVILEEILEVNNASKVQPMKGPAIELDEEKYNETFYKLIGSTCKVFSMVPEYFSTQTSASVKVLSLDECEDQLCQEVDPDFPPNCDDFKTTFDEQGLACVSVPPQPYSKSCLPYFGSPIICNGLGVGVATHVCKNQTLVFSRIDSNMPFFIKMAELQGSQMKPILFLTMFIFALSFIF